MTKTVADKLRIFTENTITLADKNKELSWDNAPAKIQCASKLIKIANAKAENNIALYFVHSKQDLLDILPQIITQSSNHKIIWLCYPKGNVTDINRDSIWENLKKLKWKPVSQIALDKAWSALRIRPE